jgi:hypothetical protein
LSPLPELARGGDADGRCDCRMDDNAALLPITVKSKEE